MLKNIIYLPYFFLKTPRNEFWNNVRDLSAIENISNFRILWDVVKCSIIYSTSFMDYFLLRFYRKTDEERFQYAGTGFMYKYQLKMNPKDKRKILSDKLMFFKHYKDFVGRKWFSLEDFNSQKRDVEKLIESSTKLVLKDSKGQAGREVEIIDSLPYEKLKKHMERNNFDLLEEFVNQHHRLQQLAPNGLNTVRIITQLDNEGRVDVLGTILRLSIYSNTDNLSVGNAAALIELSSGKVIRKAVYGDFRKEDIEVHPVSQKSIVGFEIPFWKESIDLVTSAAKESDGNKSIGWDVAITETGPILIEGNHNWGRTLWQLPENRGLKSLLERYL